ncbi:hypothetical protein KGV55_01615 [Candidatus Gracilibacteria bacterium]|nr:hypothetical protein [Candidatus Gracilibacteria bacterium]
MEKLTIKDFNADFRSKKNVETALIWNALKKTLESAGKSGLFPYVNSVNISDTTVKIITKKPIVNQELKMLEENLIPAFKKALKPLREFECEKVYFL